MKENKKENKVEKKGKITREFINQKEKNSKDMYLLWLIDEVVLIIGFIVTLLFIIKYENNFSALILLGIFAIFGNIFMFFYTRKLDMEIKRYITEFKEGK